jgi:hypothetical protein
MPASFRATIKRQGLNPYVDVPARVSRLFARLARAGRIAYEGTMNGTPIRGTLVPVGGSRHRLFVNGGMRSAAGVGVGDTPTFRISATAPHVVRPPADVTAALTAAPGARKAFDALSPSHRRELLRYVDDARTPEGRKKRIAKVVEHVTGGTATTAGRGARRGSRPGETAGSRAPSRPLWTCPKCGNQFVNRNQFHSCRKVDLSTPFAGKPRHVRALFDRFRQVVEACGPVALLAYRDKISFMVRVRFAGAVPKRNWLDIGFWLTRRVDHPRFLKVETIYPNAHVHLVRIRDLAELDDQVMGWIREAYDVGCQRHRH